MTIVPEICMHGCGGISIESYDPSNANNIRLSILRSDGSAQLSVLMFDHPKATTDKLMLAFADDKSHDRSKEKSDVAA